MASSSPSPPMPLHLLPPHIKLHILSSLHTPTTLQAPSQPPSDAITNTAVPHSSTPSLSSITPTPSTTTSVPSTHVTSVPLFTLSSLPPSTALPPPFTIEALTRLHTHGHCTIDHFLPSPTSTLLTTLHTDIEQLLTSGAFTQGGMVAGQSWKAADVRGDKVCWLSSDRSIPPSIAHVLSVLHAAVALLAAVVDGLPCVASSSQLALYEPGGRYVRHLDVRRGGGGPVRRLTAIVYLNDGWEAEWGGQLRLYERCGTAGESELGVDVLPVYGRLLLFASEEVEHEVLPATKRRVALTTWFK